MVRSTLRQACIYPVRRLLKRRLVDVISFTSRDWTANRPRDITKSSLVKAFCTGYAGNNPYRSSIIDAGVYLIRQHPELALKHKMVLVVLIPRCSISVC